MFHFLAWMYDCLFSNQLKCCTVYRFLCKTEHSSSLWHNGLSDFAWSWSLWTFSKTAFCQCSISLHESMISCSRNSKSAVLCKGSFVKLNTVHHFGTMGFQTLHDLAGLWTFSKTAFCECSISLYEIMISCSRNSKTAVLCKGSFAKLNTIHNFGTTGFQTLQDLAGLCIFSKTAFCECSISLHATMIFCFRISKTAILCTVSFVKLNTIQHFGKTGSQMLKRVTGL